MITAMSINGQYVVEPLPALGFGAFIDTYNNNRRPNVSRGVSCDELMANAERDRQRTIDFYAKKPEVQNNNAELIAARKLQADAEAKLALEQKYRAGLESGIKTSIETVVNSVIDKTALLNKFVNTNSPSVSVADDDSDSDSVADSDNSDNSDNSDDDDDDDDDNNDDGIEIIINDSDIPQSIDKMNGVSKTSNCKDCTDCHHGVQSVGCIFAIHDDTNDDYVFVLGNNSIEKSFCDYSQKLKKNPDCEKPVDRATKLLKKFINLDYVFKANKFIDVPIKDGDHVHRVFIIPCKTDTVFNKSMIIRDINNFSINKMNENLALFHKNKIINTNGITCQINKRTRKFFEMFYMQYSS